VQKTFAFREQMRIGAAIANQLPKRMGLKETAKKMGMSDTMIRRIECQALFKVQQRLSAMRLQTQLSHG
jgi:DNA-directed RNA polymerase sigma subunit (sigma70/sigma32)